MAAVEIRTCTPEQRETSQGTPRNVCPVVTQTLRNGVWPTRERIALPARGSSTPHDPANKRLRNPPDAPLALTRNDRDPAIMRNSVLPGSQKENVERFPLHSPRTAHLARVTPLNTHFPNDCIVRPHCGKQTHLDKPAGSLAHTARIRHHRTPPAPDVRSPLLVEIRPRSSSTHFHGPRRARSEHVIAARALPGHVPTSARALASAEAVLVETRRIGVAVATSAGTPSCSTSTGGSLRMTMSSRAATTSQRRAAGLQLPNGGSPTRMRPTRMRPGRIGADEKSLSSAWGPRSRKAARTVSADIINRAWRRLFGPRSQENRGRTALLEQLSAVRFSNRPVRCAPRDERVAEEILHCRRIAIHRNSRHSSWCQGRRWRPGRAR